MEQLWEIRRYRAENKKIWDDFIDGARNATFLFRRDYMDYHSDRYVDHSLLAYRKGKLMAVLPANEEGKILFSHHGLTYGGWCFSGSGLDVSDIYRLWRSFLEYCQEQGIKSVVYKPLPWIYAEMPSDEDKYMLFLCDAELLSTDISSAIDLENNPGFDKLQTRHLKKVPASLSTGVIEADDDAGIAEFYEMLVGCLGERHGTTPVHTLPELLRLMKAFPDNIELWVVWDENEDDKLLGGILIYLGGLCAHCQYIATTAEGREKNVLARLVNDIIENYEEEGMRYLDFGISNEDGGRYLNAGLNRQKTSYGASGVAYTRYLINVTSALESMPSVLWPAHRRQP